MHKQSFYRLHALLEPYLNAHFFPKQGGKRCPKTNPYLIDTKLRLSIALRVFAGGSPLDIMVSHGVSFTSIFTSLWGVMACVNKCPDLAFHFPTHEEQREIAEEFRKKSGADFDCIIGAIDGLLIWTLKPTLKLCRMMQCGEAQFKCSRKDKFGLNMQAICDHELKFRWVEIKWPGCSSDFMAWCTSSLCHQMENNHVTNILLEGMSLAGDNAYVKTMTMSVPLKGERQGYDDAYNFYLSQLRITIERAFSVLVHRWSILRAPLCFPITKIPSLMKCLCRLHNFCINEGKKMKKSERPSPQMNDRDVSHIQELVNHSNRLYKNSQSRPQQIVQFNEDGSPVSLVGGGSHYGDAPINRRPIDGECPMDRMRRKVEEMDLARPEVQGRKRKRKL